MKNYYLDEDGNIREEIRISSNQILVIFLVILFAIGFINSLFEKNDTENTTSKDIETQQEQVEKQSDEFKKQYKSEEEHYTITHSSYQPAYIPPPQEEMSTEPVQSKIVTPKLRGVEEIDTQTGVSIYDDMDDILKHKRE